MLKINTIVIIISILSGCQLNNKKREINEDRVSQITAITAALHFLKEDCNIGGIPNKQNTINAIIKIADLKGEITTQYYYDKLINKSEILYQQIKKDPTHQDIKCLELGNVLNDFIKKIKE